MKKQALTLARGLALWLAATAPAANAAPDLPAFSSMTANGAIAGWQPLKPAPKAKDTRYTLVRDGDKVVLKAQAEGAMSGLTALVRVNVKDFPLLRWRWKVSTPLKTADMTAREGDDYAARVYVLFDYPIEKLPFGTRTKLKFAEAVYGVKIPTAALNYVWDNRQPIGTLQANTYTDRARMVVLETGRAKAGQWVTETRDLAADFRASFGEDPPDIVAVALATDTDNTGESVTAWYGDFEFLPPPKAAEH